MQSPRLPQQGFSLIEILLILGVLAAVAIGMFLLYPQVRASRMAVSEQANMQSIAGNTKHLFMLKGYQGLNNGVANTARLFPSNMNANRFTFDQEITSAWGGTVTIGPSPDITGLFRVTYEDTPHQVCIEFARSMMASYERVLIEGVTIKNELDAGTPVSGVVDIIDLCRIHNPATITIETR